MSLTFTEAASGEEVNYGSGAALDNPDAGTLLILVKPSNVNNTARWLAGKTSVGEGYHFHRRGADGTTIRIVRNRATTNQEAFSTTSALASGAWAFVGGSFNVAGTPSVYAGTLTAAPTDISTTQTAGSGTKFDDSAASLVTGHQGSGGSTTSFPGDIAFFGLWLGRALTLAEIQRVWREVCRGGRPYMAADANCVVYDYYGRAGATAHNFSGSGVLGTVTGVSQSANPPLPLLFDKPRSLPYVVAAAPGGTVGPLIGGHLVKQGILQGRLVR